MNPPRDQEAELAVLGAVLMADAGALAAVVEEGLRSEDFYREQSAVVFEAMLQMHADGEPIDFLTLRDRLRREGKLTEVGGQAALDRLAGAVPNVGHLRQYARIVVRKAMWRQRLRLLLGAVEGGGAIERENEAEYRATMGTLRQVELHYRPLLERETPAP